MFILSYYDILTQTFTAAIYKMVPNVEAENDNLLFA